MRLTLRTLLAWLDDTLSPSEVRQIGQQVSESSFAQELVERIHRVTRRRRLTVPEDQGPEGTDPNLVASYLDNELSPEAVAEFEKRCLTSDVHLAEVASVHQILSLIGQKAKVPPETRHRMYRLIKGREALIPSDGTPTNASEPSPVTEPLPPWVTPEPPPRPWYERIIPVLAVVGLTVLLGWSAWTSLTPPSPADRFAVAAGSASEPAPPPGIAPPRPAGPEGALEFALPVPPGVADQETEPVGDDAAADRDGDAPADRDDETETAPEPDDGPAPTELGAGALGRVEHTTGVLLRRHPQERSWEHLDAEDPLHADDHLVGLAPYRTTLQLGTSVVELVGLAHEALGSAQILVRAPQAGQSAHFELIQGRVVVQTTEGEDTIVVQCAGQSVTLRAAPHLRVGLERLDQLVPGEPGASISALLISAAEGEVELDALGRRTVLTGPGVVELWPLGRFEELVMVAPPFWVIDPEPSAYEGQLGEQFEVYLQPGRIVPGLVEATEDPQDAIRQLAIEALGAIGEYEPVVWALNKPNARSQRRAAIITLRGLLAQGPDAAQAVHAQLEQEGGPAWAETVETLLVGYAPDEAQDPTTLAHLVDLLRAPDPGVRELALDNLRALTGRSSLGYDPDEPNGPGLRAWEELLEPAAARRSPAAPRSR